MKSGAEGEEDWGCFCSGNKLSPSHYKWVFIVSWNSYVSSSKNAFCSFAFHFIYVCPNVTKNNTPK